ncbi:hypothetical protein VTN00DRAFT_822 [Thermoascus crustaceus]|uniref:uncharacterized protein n=1 Tax=Thermoascus crustaceus TaxID=5088 RepID=UPI003743B53A
MAAIMKRWGRKRTLSSEMHSRWGDVSITSPNEGSWSQHSSSNVNIGATLNVDYGSGHTRRYDSLEGGGDSESRPHSGKSKPSSASRFISRLCPRDPGIEESMHNSMVAIPRGHYETGSRYQSEVRLERGRQSFRTEESSPVVDGTTADELVSKETDMFDPRYRFSSMANDRDDEVSPASNIEKSLHEVQCVEEDGHGARKSPESPQEGHESRLPRGSKSPPLSVTSRMRRASQQSTTTGQTTLLCGTTSSRHTSYTSSSVSSPSTLPETPQITKIAYNPAFRDKRHARRSRLWEPERVGAQELVPSYEELYG